MDCGHGSFSRLQELMPEENVTGVVISHEHLDHCIEASSLFIKYAYGSTTDKKWPVYAAPGVAAALEVHTGKPLTDVFKWNEIDETARATIGSIDFRFSRTDHPVHCLAMELTSPTARLVYTADTGPGWSVSAFDPGADLVLSEASYQDAHMGKPIHLSARQAGEAARSANARALMVTHIWPTLDLEISSREASEGFGSQVLVAQPDTTVQLGTDA